MQKQKKSAKKASTPKAVEYRVGDQFTLRGAPEECKERDDPDHKPRRCPVCSECEIKLVRQFDQRTFATVITSKGMGGAGSGQMTIRDLEKYRKSPIVRAKKASAKASNTPRTTKARA